MRKPLRTLGALAVLTLLLGAARPAAAQQIIEVAKVEQKYGYTLYNDTWTMWASISSAGYITKGYFHIARDYHGSGTIYMTGSLTAREIYDLWVGVYNARPWDHAVTYASFQNTDLSNHDVTYYGRYTQTIVRNLTSSSQIPSGAARTSTAMSDFIQAAGQTAQRIGDLPVFRYDAGGGMLGYRRTLVLSANGKISDEVSYFVTHPSAQPYQKSGQLSPAQLNGLKQLVYDADWFNLSGWQGRPSMVDGIDEEGTYFLWGTGYLVTAGWSHERTPEYQAVLDEAKRLADGL